MSKIILLSSINAAIENVFNNCRNLDLHTKSASKTNEKAIAGRTSGLIEKGETVTWKGKHFGLYISHQSIISEMDFPNYFIDEQLKGKFKDFKHTHRFKEKDGTTFMLDIIEYKVPFGILGKLFDSFLLKKHLINFIKNRNQFLKETSENQQQNPPKNRNSFNPKTGIIFRFFI